MSLLVFKNMKFDKSGMTNRRQYQSEGIVKNEIFTATMKIIDFSQGRSSIKVVLQDEAGNFYGMFFSDFEYLVKNSTIVDGVFTDKFHYRNQSGYIGLVAHAGREVLVY